MYHLELISGIMHDLVLVNESAVLGLQDNGACALKFSKLITDIDLVRGALSASNDKTY